MATFHFDLVSPEKLAFSGEVDQVDVPGVEGDFGVLAGHAPVVAAIRPRTDDAMVEIGPGLGALTAPLAALLLRIRRHDVEIGGTQIERDANGRTSLRIRDIVVRDAEGTVVASAPRPTAPSKTVAPTVAHSGRRWLWRAGVRPIVPRPPSPTDVTRNDLKPMRDLSSVNRVAKMRIDDANSPSRS